MPVSRLEEFFPTDFEHRIAIRPLIVLPFGTVEWHSHHLPIGLDSLKAQALCEGIAQRADAVLGPLTSWAVGGMPFPHTLRFDLDLIETLMVSVFEQMALLGFRVVLALTGHYGLEQTLAINRASLRVMRANPVTIWAAGDFEAVVDLGYHGDHAAKWETSVLWAQRPDLIRLDARAPSEPLDGIIGTDPRTSASAELGTSTMQAIVDRWAALGERLLTNTTAVQRIQYVEALAAGVRVMERLLDERATNARSQVPALITPSYLGHLAALYGGDYPAAQKNAETKLIDLAM